ncbi:MAG: helix-turn-helix domain-containing protein [Bdellovibrionia bacterium]
MSSHNHLKKRHRMHEFGTVLGVGHGVRVNRLEKRLDPLVPFPHRHDFYHLVIVTAGKGWHEIDFRRYPVQPLQAFFMKPGQVHSWKLNQGTKGFIVEFGSDASDTRTFTEIPDQINLPHIPTVVKLMLDEYENQLQGFEASLQHYVAALMIELTRYASEKKTADSASDPALDRFLELVEEHFRKEHRVEFYAKLLRTTPKAITMRASRSLGRSARSVIQERCLLEAQRLLAYSNLTIAEIGYELGFDDPNYFSRFFKTLGHSSPGDFRSRVKTVT